MEHTITVPGNLLLMGEYAVLEQGGLGITIAPEVRTVITLCSSPSLEIEGVMKSSRIIWNKQQRVSGLLDTLVGSTEDYLESRGVISDLTGKIFVDSSSLYYQDGRKSGFGSSAAVAVGVTAALLLLAGIPKERIEAVCSLLAHKGHSLYQGKQGSGYDILTSFHGGIGLFSGGHPPSVKKLKLPWFPSAALFRGADKVASSSAITAFADWKRQNPGKAKQFIEHSNKCVLGFARASSWEAAVPWFREGRDRGLELGEDLGFSASLNPPGGAGKSEFKALGAGNELGVVLGGTEVKEGFTPLVPAERGLTWSL